MSNEINERIDQLLIARMKLDMIPIHCKDDRELESLRIEIYRHAKSVRRQREKVGLFDELYRACSSFTLKFDRKNLIIYIESRLKLKGVDTLQKAVNDAHEKLNVVRKASDTFSQTKTRCKNFNTDGFELFN